MKVLILGGNRFVGLRLSLLLEKIPNLELHILNRTGQAPHCPSAIVYKGDRRYLASLYLDKEWDMVFDFCCYNEKDAESAVGFFSRVGQYIFISTVSVYNSGRDLKEEAFNAKQWDLNQPAALSLESAYQDGKRRAEAVFEQKANFPVLSVRFPYILGPDDYTERFEFHVRRVQRGHSIFVINPEALFSVIHSQDAAEFLLWTVDKNLRGPLNVASFAPTSVSEMLSQIELLTEKKPILAKNSDEENLSPYSQTTDWYVNTEHLERLGFQVRPFSVWLAELIQKSDTIQPKGFTH